MVCQRIHVYVICSSYSQAAWFHTDLTTPLPPLHTFSLSKDCEEAVDEDVLTNMVQCITSAELVSATYGATLISQRFWEAEC